VVVSHFNSIQQHEFHNNLSNKYISAAKGENEKPNILSLIKDKTQGESSSTLIFKKEETLGKAVINRENLSVQDFGQVIHSPMIINNLKAHPAEIFSRTFKQKTGADFEPKDFRDSEGNNLRFKNSFECLKHYNTMASRNPHASGSSDRGGSGSGSGRSGNEESSVSGGVDNESDRPGAVSNTYNTISDNGRGIRSPLDQFLIKD